MRVIISTQEPTVCPSNLLDLCSFIVCHRFFSAGWFGHLAKHVSSELDSDAFERVVMLDVSLSIQSGYQCRHTDAVRAAFQ